MSETKSLLAERWVKMPEKIPFAALFAEAGEEHFVPSVSYSQDGQVGLWEPKDILTMGATSISTKGGDTIGDTTC